MKANSGMVAQRYEETDTDALLQEWVAGGLLDWAEELLREELLKRGVEPDQLQQLSEFREIERNTRREWQSAQEFSILGLFQALLVGGLLSALMNVMIGEWAAFLAMGSAGFFYCFLLIRHIAYLNRVLPEGAMAFARFLRLGIVLMIVFGGSLMCIMKGYARFNGEVPGL